MCLFVLVKFIYFNSANLIIQFTLKLYLEELSSLSINSKQNGKV